MVPNTELPTTTSATSSQTSVASTLSIHSTSCDLPYTVYDPEAVQSPYYHYAIEAMEVVYKRFPRGAVNQQEVSESLQLSKNELSNQLLNLQIIDEEFNEDKCDIHKLAGISETMDRGNCGLMACYALGFLLNKYETLRVEQVFLEEHSFIAIGRKKHSNPAQIAAWDALICGLWEKLIYRSSAFDTVKRGKNIPFYANLCHKDLKIIMDIELSTQHYLSGSPKIIISESSKEIDDFIKAWVKEDMLRWQKRDFKTTFALSPYTTARIEVEKNLRSFHQFTSGFSSSSAVAVCSASTVESQVRFLSSVIHKQYSSEEKMKIRSQLEKLTGHPAECWKITTKEGLKIYLSMENSAAVIALKNAFNKTGALKATERIEKGKQEALILELSQVKTESLTKIECLPGYKKPEALPSSEVAVTQILNKC